MLFKFIWVAITALALYGCPPNDGEDDDNGDDENVLSLDSSTATWNATDGVVLAGTVKEGDKAKGKVKVVFTVKCGDEDAATVTATSGDDGKVSAKIAADDVDGATDAATLKTCKVTAKVGEGEAAVDETIQAGTAAAADKLMGMVHELTWTTAPSCPNTLIYKVAGTDLAGSDTTTIGASGTDVKLLVLPIAKTGVNDCTIGTTVVKFAAAAFSDTANAAAVEDDSTTPCAAAICFADDGDGTLTAWADDNDVSSGEKWIKKTGNNYVYHDVK